MANLIQQLNLIVKGCMLLKSEPIKCSLLSILSCVISIDAFLSKYSKAKTHQIPQLLLIMIHNQQAMIKLKRHQFPTNPTKILGKSIALKMRQKISFFSAKIIHFFKDVIDFPLKHFNFIHHHKYFLIFCVLLRMKNQNLL